MKLAQRGYRASSLFCLQPPRPTLRAIGPIPSRTLHTTPSNTATPLPHPVAPGPPPKAPTPATSPQDDRIDRKKRNAELLERGKKLRTNPTKPGTALQKRFWKDVSVFHTEEGYQIFLDKKAVRTPSKHALTIPTSKPHLATAIALEWDLLVSAQQALKHHYIPLTSLTSRALDIATADKIGDTGVRDSIVKLLMGYLTTDTLLCWNPAPNDENPSTQPSADVNAGASGGHASGKSLRQLQIDAAEPIIGFLTSYIWPGVEIRPALQDGGIMPQPQPEMTSNVIRGWVSGLGAWELAGLERACLATKSLCVGTRLLVEWSGLYEQKDWLRGGEGEQGKGKFSIEDAAEACSQEVRWQTGMWGEVEDTHDVDKEDLRRQLGSVIMLVNEDCKVSAP